MAKLNRINLIPTVFCFFFVSAAAAQTLPAVQSYSPAYELERTKEALRSKATDAKIRRLSDQYREKKLKAAPSPHMPAVQNAAADRKVMKLKRLIFDRSALLSDQFLEGIARRYEGKEISIRDIEEIVNEVDRAYKDRGYFAAKAYVPNQDIRDNILKINLIEGKIDKINIKDNKSTNENFVRRHIGATSGEILNVNHLQDNILMFNAAHDVKARVALAPGEKFATTDVDVLLEEPQRVAVSAFADNAGQKSTGIYRAGALAGIHSLTGYRDNLNLGGVITDGSHALFGAFDIPEPWFQTRIGIGADYSDTEIVGGDLKALDVTGNFYNYYFYFKRPVYVTDSFINNLSFTTSFKNGATYIGDFRTQKVYTDTLNLTWDTLKLFSGGYFYSQFGVTKGAELIDGERSFWRFNYNGEFQRALWYDFAFNIRAKAQYSEQSFLPSSEQFQIGGVNSVRGYTEGMLVGDKGFAVMNELQYDLKPLIKADWIDSAQAFVFLDFGHAYAKASNNQKNANQAFIYSTGAGARVGLAKRLSANFTVAFPLKEHDYYDKDEDVEFLFFIQTKIW